MATINVNRKIDDNFYRYKMPAVLIKVEGRGNGIKTVIVNLPEISRAINRSPLYPLKFIGCELGAQTSVNKKEEKYIVNGTHSLDKIQSLLDVFIEKYVLCNSCGNPETNIYIVQKKDIKMVCMACGHSSGIPNTHRVSSFILKNPPTSEKGKQKGSKGMTAATNDNEIEEQDQNIDENIPNSGVTVDKNVKKSKKIPIQERLETLRLFVAEKVGQMTKINDFCEDIEEEIARLNLRKKGIFAVAVGLLADNILENLKKYFSILKVCVNGDVSKMEYLINAIENIINVEPDLNMPYVSFHFKILFDTEIVDEEVFLGWEKKTSSKYIKPDLFAKMKLNGKEYLDWLKNVDDSDESENKSEEDLKEIIFDQEIVEKQETQQTIEDNFDDLNIDDI